MAANSHILLGDIGGTQSRLAITPCDHFELKNTRVFEARNFAAFEAVLSAYLKEEQVTGLVGASLAPAGPIEDGHDGGRPLANVLGRRPAVDAAAMGTTSGLDGRRR